MEPEVLLIAGVFTAGMAAGVYVIYLGLKQQTLHNEMRHRERMAMIERGQIPLDPQRLSGGRSRSGAGNSRALSIGIIIMGLGLALAMLIGFAGDNPEIAVGVGGAIFVLGAAFVVRSVVVRPESAPEEPRQMPPVPPAQES